MSRIYDSSALTQRRRDQAQAGSFINRIQNPNNPQTSYGPLQGNYDASIMNSVKMGQPKEFYRNSGCIIISNGCPCPPIAVNEIISDPTPPVILVPGPVSNIQVEYGSVIVTWNAPTEGGPPTSYTVSAIPPPGGTTITVTGVPTTTYSFATGALDAGTVYEMSVIGVNAAGNGSTSSPSSPISAPFIAPVYTATSSEFFPNRIDITLTPYTTFTPTKYILKTYTNDVLTSTSSPTNYSSDLIVVNSGLSCLNVYSFQVQLFNNTQYSSFSVKGANVPVYPYGPDFLPSPNDITNITTTTAQVNYADYTIEGFDLTTGNAECILNSIPTIGYSNLTNTSVTLTGLIPGREYFSRSITISFRKTINGNVITSSPLSIPSFTTDNIIPGSVSNIIAIYGTTGTNVTWDAPTTGGTVASYTLFADDQTTPANSVTITGITDVSYTFPTYTGPAVNQLTAGDEYLFRVTAVNSAGSGTAGVSSSFYAPYIAPVVTSSEAPTTNNATIIFNAYSSTSGTPGQFDFTGATFSIPGVTIGTITQPNQIYISNLVTATTYTGCTMTLTGASGAISGLSNTFTIVTKSNAPTSLGAGNLANTPVTFTFDQYTPFTSGVTTITLFATENGTTSVSFNASNITNQSMTISALQPQATYTNAYIIIYNGGIISLPSNEISSFTMPYTNPTITLTSTKTCRTQELEFSYGYFTPTGAVIVAPSGVTVSAISGSNPYYVTLENLTPNTSYLIPDTPSYSTIKIQFTGGNPGDISQYSNVPSFTTPPIIIEGQITALHVGTDVGDVTTDYIIMRFNPFTSFGTTGVPATNAIVTTSNGGVITTYSASFNTTSYDNIKISDLTPGQELINPTIILTDTTNCVQSSPDTYVGNIRTYYNAPTNVVIGSITQDTVVVNFTFGSFQPSTAPYTTVTSGGTELTVSTVTSSSVTITGLTPGTTYSDYKLRLGNSNGEFAEPVTIPDFTPQWPAPTHVASAPDGIYTNQALITYLDYSPTFGASSGTLSGISGGIITNVTNGGFIIYNLSPGTLYSQGSFFLTNNSSPPLDTGSASIPEFITNGGPNTPTSIQVGTVTTDSASITFSQYGFTPAQIICETYTGGEFISVTVDSDQSATLTGLAYPRGYNVKIRVIYNDQTSQWSDPFSFST
jgi:hypothetical protein